MLQKIGHIGTLLAGLSGNGDLPPIESTHLEPDKSVRSSISDFSQWDNIKLPDIQTFSPTRILAQASPNLRGLASGIDSEALIEAPIPPRPAPKPKKNTNWKLYVGLTVAAGTALLLLINKLRKKPDPKTYDEDKAQRHNPYRSPRVN